MANLKTMLLKSIIKEEVKRALSEARTPFKGRTAGDLYNVVKNMNNFEVFANNEPYTVDVDDLRQNKTSNTVYLLDGDGESMEFNVSDIEFISSYGMQ